jgi:hypothetical protein
VSISHWRRSRSERACGSGGAEAAREAAVARRRSGSSRWSRPPGGAAEALLLGMGCSRQVGRQPAQLAPQGCEAGAAMEERAWNGNGAKVTPLEHHGQENVPESWPIANMIIHDFEGVVETAATFKKPR